MNDDKYAKLRELLAKLEAIFVEYDASWDADTKSKGLPIGDFMSIMDMLRPFIDDHSSLLADLDAATRERDDIKSNVENAVRCAKEYCPNYPWTLNTASEAVWATGESYKGVSAARDDLHKDLDAATADLKAVSAALDGLAEHNVKLRTENAKLREALEHELKRLERYTDRTHIMGVECDHPACKAAERIRAALARATLEGKQ
jgi:regulator of replication initiation timing